MKNDVRTLGCRWFATLAAVLGWAAVSQAQPFLQSVSPDYNQAGVSTSAQARFTFTEEMEPLYTYADFLDVTTFRPVATVATWNASHTVLTCTPVSGWPAGATIYWTVNGEDTFGIPMDEAFGIFFTVGGAGGGSGTNQITYFSLGKSHYYQQNSAAAPTLHPEEPFGFFAMTSLASNRTANLVTLTLPNGGVSNLVQSFFSPEDFTLGFFTNTQASLDATFPSGTYTFTVTATTNQTVPVNFPSTLVQPNAPQILNYTAAQSVNATQAFTLTWAPMQNGTVNDYIHVQAGPFLSPVWGKPGALNGTATSYTFPAGTFASGSNYLASVSFTRYTSYTSNANHSTIAHRTTETEFQLQTAGGATGALVFTNLVWGFNTFRFDVQCAVGQTFTVEYKTALTPGPWTKLVTTNSTGTSVRLEDNSVSTAAPRFYRAREGT